MISQSTVYNYTFFLQLSVDLTPATGVTPAVQISKAGAAFAAAAGAVTEISLGWYRCAFTAIDTGTLGDLAIVATAATCDPHYGKEQIQSSSGAAPTAAAIRIEMDANSTRLANLDVATSTRLATAGYTAPPAAAPTVAAIRAEMDANSTKLDVAVSTRLSTAGYTAPGVAPTAIENADALLKRDMSAVVGETARSPLNAFRAIRNKVSRTGGTLTITREDDVTPAWTAAITTDAAAVPITVVDPA